MKIELKDLSDSELECFNNLRSRGDMSKMTKEEALRLLNSMEGVSQTEAIIILADYK